MNSVKTELQITFVFTLQYVADLIKSQAREMIYAVTWFKFDQLRYEIIDDLSQ